MRLPGQSRHPRIDLADATVLVTGAARGIGLATTRAFLDRGARVVMTDLDGDLVADVAASLGDRTSAAPLDVRDASAFRDVVGGLGRVDVLVNNAGVMPVGRFLDEDETTSDLTLDVNVRGPINGMRAVLPPMIAAGRGHVVNIASMLGRVPTPGLAVYTASKFAAVGLTEAVRREVEGTGVTITAIMPTAVRTELTSGLKLEAGMPTVDPEDVAAAVVASVDHRRGSVSVPSWLGPVTDVLALTPTPVLNGVRRLLHEDRALTALDGEARQAYDDRLTRQRGA